MTSAKLAIRNVKKSLRDFTIYFLTLTFGVCVFYIFNSLESQEAMMDISNNQAAIFQQLMRVIGGVSVFVSVILGFLILYANRFLIRRRKKEFGIYMTLGMEKGAISRILMVETVFVGLLSLATGLATGILLSQAMSVLTAKLMDVPISRFHFVFSPDAFGKTIIYFAIIFLFVLIFNTIIVSREKLIDLIYASKKNEWYKTPPLAVSVLTFAAAACCLAFGYWKGLSSDISELLGGALLPLIAALCIVGTFLFFFSLSGFFMNLVQRNKRVYLKDLNMFVLRQIGSKINTAYVSITIVCLVLFISICTLSTGMGMSTSISKELKESTPFDASVVASVKTDDDGDAVGEYPGFDFAAAFDEDRGAGGIDAFAKDYLAVRFYDSGTTIPLNVVEGNQVNLIDANVQFMKLSDYNDILKLRGIDPIELDSGEYAVNFAVSNRGFKAAMEEYMKNADVIKLRKTELQTNPDNLYRYTLNVVENQDYNVCVIVDDPLVKGLPAARDILSVNYPGEASTYDTALGEAVSALKPGKDIKLSALTATEVGERSNSATVIVSYLAIYLGVIFLITAAAVLAIGQLSEISDNASRYGLLRKIGTDEKMIHKSILKQNLIYFGVPMLLGVVHATVGITVINRLISAFDKGDIAQTSLFVAVVLLIVYGGYFIATYQSSKGILDRESALMRAE
ncbi:MAG: ABC transporter permease [Clostridiales Family XIII bacterium]|jgi:putative ABC transport system permease protein|nr:ABC transporter permease [Clostridiales Family XIII bacterium]